MRVASFSARENGNQSGGKAPQSKKESVNRGANLDRGVFPPPWRFVVRFGGILLRRDYQGFVSRRGAVAGGWRKYG